MNMYNYAQTLEIDTQVRFGEFRLVTRYHADDDHHTYLVSYVNDMENYYVWETKNEDGSISYERFDEYC